MLNFDAPNTFLQQSDNSLKTASEYQAMNTSDQYNNIMYENCALKTNFEQSLTRTTTDYLLGSSSSPSPPQNNASVGSSSFADSSSNSGGLRANSYWPNESQKPYKPSSPPLDIRHSSPRQKPGLSEERATSWMSRPTEPAALTLLESAARSHLRESALSFMRSATTGSNSGQTALELGLFGNFKSSPFSGSYVNNVNFHGTQYSSEQFSGSTYPQHQGNNINQNGFNSGSHSGAPLPHSTPAHHPYLHPNNYHIGMDPTRRKNATRENTATLKAWLQEHIKNPYPTKGEKIMLAIITKMTLTQVSTWFANARRRLKKENKITWSPKMNSGGASSCEDVIGGNGTRTGVDDFDNDQSEDEENDVQLRGSPVYSQGLASSEDEEEPTEEQASEGYAERRETGFTNLCSNFPDNSNHNSQTYTNTYQTQPGISSFPFNWSGQTSHESFHSEWNPGSYLNEIPTPQAYSSPNGFNPVAAMAAISEHYTRQYTNEPH